MTRSNRLDGLRVGDRVILNDGRTGYLNKLVDQDGKSRRSITAGTARILLNSDVPLNELSWGDIEIVVPIETVTRIESNRS